MAVEVKKRSGNGIAHVLFIDIVGYSKLLMNEHGHWFDTLNQIVRATDELQSAEQPPWLVARGTIVGCAQVGAIQMQRLAHRTRQTPGAITNALAREVHALDLVASERDRCPKSFGGQNLIGDAEIGWKRSACNPARAMRRIIGTDFRGWRRKRLLAFGFERVV